MIIYDQNEDRGGRILPEERRLKMYEYIRKKGVATTKELSKLFGISESTVRRDLNELELRGLIKRTFRGAVFQHLTGETTFMDNMKLMRREKEAIAEKALEHIYDGDFIILGGGTTVYSLVLKLLQSDISNLTVITNSLNVGMKILQSGKRYDLIFVGGKARYGTFECVGDDTIDMLDRYNVGKAFIGVNGISHEFGVSMSNREESAIARAMIRRSMEVFVLADHTKFNVVKAYRVCGKDEVDLIITDDGLDTSILEEFRKRGWRIEIVHRSYPDVDHNTGYHVHNRSEIHS